MLDFSRNEALRVRGRNISLLRSFRISGGAFYKHLTPNGVLSVHLTCTKIFCTTQWLTEITFRAISVTVLIDFAAKFRKNPAAGLAAVVLQRQRRHQRRHSPPRETVYERAIPPRSFARPGGYGVFV